MKRLPYFLVGLLAWLSLICSISAVQAVNGNLMSQGFQQFSQTAHLNVSPASYPAYASAIASYLDGKTDLVRVPAADGSSGQTAAFSDRENAHLRDVRGVITCLKWTRWIGGGGTVVLIAFLYLRRKNEREALLRSFVRGFAGAAIALLAAAALLGVWGFLNFPGLFWTFHQVVFPNDLWLLNPQTDLLMALMPIRFFTWYAGEILKSLLPILGAMLLTIIAYFKTKERTK